MSCSHHYASYRLFLSLALASVLAVIVNAQCGSVPCGMCSPTVTGTANTAAYFSSGGNNLTSDAHLLLGANAADGGPRFADYRNWNHVGTVWTQGAWTADTSAGSPNANVAAGGIATYGNRAGATTMSSTSGGVSWLTATGLQISQAVTGINSNNKFIAARLGTGTAGTVADGLTLTDDTDVTRATIARSTGKIALRGKGDAAAVIGQVTLAAGKATVHTTAFADATWDYVFLSRKTAAGTLGQLSYSGGLAGVGFNVTSSSGTETSVVNWMLHRVI